MTWTKVHVKYKRRSLEAYSPDWKRGKEPFAVLATSRHERSVGEVRPRSTKILRAHGGDIELKARAAMLVEHGTSEREAIALAMLDMGESPSNLLKKSIVYSSVFTPDGRIAQHDRIVPH